MSTPRRSPITENVRHALAAEALAFLGDVYGLDAAQRSDLAGVAVAWKQGRRRRMAFYRPAHPRTGRAPYISIAVPPGAASRWVTYDRVHACLTTPRGGIEVPILLHLVLCLVHEYTHAVQDGACGGRKRRFLEAEPTKNEIEFVRRHAPDVYAQLVNARPLKSARARASGRDTGQTGGTVSRSLRVLLAAIGRRGKPR